MEKLKNKVGDKMGKIYHAMMVLKILHEAEGNFVKGSEIAKTLNITERQVRRIITDLKSIGADIGNKPGPSGGYTISDCPICKKNRLGLS